MKLAGQLLVSLALILLSAPVAQGQDLSAYRNFKFGMSPAEVAKQVAPQTLQARPVYKHPTIVDEMTWWPRNLSGTSESVQPVWQILFTFFDGELCRVLVTYNSQATKGLTDEDMIEVISREHGPATRLKAAISFPTSELYSSTEIVIARWEDSQYSFNLFRASSLNSYGLVMFSKRLDTQVRAAFADLRAGGIRAADPREMERQKAKADELEATRQKNKELFRP